MRTVLRRLGTMLAGALAGVLAGGLALCGLLLAAPAAAHPMPESRVWIDTTPGGLRLSLQLPLNRLEFAFGQPLADAPQQVLARHAEALARYLLQHVGARSGQLGWTALRPTLAVAGSDSTAELEAVLDLRAPPGADARAPTLLYDAVTHEVRTHRVQVMLRNDWAGGLAGQPPVLLGTLDTAHTSLALPLAPPRTGASLWRLVSGGVVHIAEGLDHLLFLGLLLLVAPLAVQAGRWQAGQPVGQVLRRVAAVVSAFTLGHTVTLALGSSGTLVLPAAPVEMAVAATLIVAALHALWPLPLLRQRGALGMALAFGLVHGFAFSASLSGAGLTVGQHALALLAFNTGIELMQLAVVLLLMPPLLVLSHRHPAAYGRLRQALAVAAAVVAMLWLLERAGLAGVDTTAWTDAAARGLPLAVVALWLAAALAWLPRYWPARIR